MDSNSLVLAGCLIGGGFVAVIAGLGVLLGVIRRQRATIAHLIEERDTWIRASHGLYAKLHPGGNPLSEYAPPTV